MTRRLNALVVDDSTTTRKLVMRALTQTGLADFVFTEAQDGLDALEKYRPGETQILFVDMNLPRMDGLAFTRKLRSKHVDCPPIVMITGETSTDKQSEAIKETGIAAFLLKPVDRDRLQAGLRKLIDAIPEDSGPCIVPHGECVPQAFERVLAKACDVALTVAPEDEVARGGQIVLGMMALHGDVNWSVTLGFTQRAANVVASRLAGCELSSDDVDTGDAIGEITNIVGGSIKSLLAARNIASRMTLPTVIGATGFRILLQHRNTTSCVSFETPAGPMWSVVTVGIDMGLVL